MIIIIALAFFLRNTLSQTYVPCDKYPGIIAQAQYRFPNKACSRNLASLCVVQSDPDAMTLAATYGDPISFGFVKIMLFTNGCHISCSKCTVQNQADKCMQGCASPTRESHNDIEEVIYEMIPFTCPCISGYEEYVPKSSDCKSLCQLPCQTCVTGSGVNCQTCSNPLTMVVQNMKCICITNYFMLNNACVSYDVATCTECVQSPACLAYTKRDASCICIQQYYDGGTLICKKCHSTCRTCDNATSCLTCQPGTNRDMIVYPHTCLCSNGYSEDLASDICRVCESTCQTCAKSNYMECTSCYSNVKRYLTNKTCKCWNGYYNVEGQMTCLRCHYSCFQCFGSGWNQCSSCGEISKTHRYLTSLLSCKCESTYYGQVAGQQPCFPCNVRCEQCYWADQCASCKAEQFRQKSGVECVCRNGYYQNGANDICDACHYSCKTCTGPQINECLTCDSTIFRTYDNAGGCPCQLSHIDVGVSTCAKCYYECLTCDSVNANSCLSCPTTRIEVPSELPGHYYCKCELSNSTGAGSYQLCKLCHYSCATCSDVYNFNCLTCNSRTLYMDQCVCQSNQYDDGVNDICPQCHQTCLTCSNSTNTSCLTCSASEYRILSGTTCECIPGYVLDTTTFECLKCDYRCERCINNIYHCTTCPVGSLRSLNTTNNVCECQGDSPNDKPGEPKCQTCHYSCSNCNTENVSDCTICNQSIQRYFENGYCYCSSHYYDDGSNEECKICSDYCVNCVSTSTNCTSCDDTMNRILVGNECQCKIKSPTQLISYYVDLNSICQQCHFTCLTCSGSQYYNCLTCSAMDFRILSGTECICKPRHIELGVSICSACNYTCDECVDSKFKCITCPTNTFRIFDGNRYTCDCDSGYFDNGFQDCQLCNTKCKTCAQQSTTCTSCKLGEFRKLVNSSCICIDKYYDVGSGSCVQCHHSCQTCTGPADNNCTLCPEYSVSKRIMSSSQCNCVDGYYDDGTQFCQLCITICQTCLASASNCSSCVSGQFRVLQSGNCVCIDGYYSSSQPTCVSCSPYCKTCQNQAQTCFSCPDGSKRILNSTTNECLCKPGTTDVGGVICQDCHYTCGRCANTVTTCSTCPDFSMRQLTTSYTCPCITGAYDDGVAVCKQCDSTCATCITSAFNCVTCDPIQNRIKAGSQCECKNGYWEELPTKICKLCDFSCLTCFGSATQCLTCDANLNRMLVGQSCLCQSDKYLNAATQTCDACGVKCAQCSGTATSCDSCPSSRYLSGNQCLCDPGYYDTGLAMCAECAFKCKTCVTAATNCLSCQTNANRYQLGNDCPCQIKYYQQGSGNIRNCDLCHYSCAECITSQDKCTACTTDSIVNRSAVSNNKCLCKPGYYDDGTINCKQCHYTCLTCITIATKCTSCEISVSFRQDLSISSYSCPCKSTFYDNGKLLCKKCAVQCIICQGQYDNCTLCNSNSGNNRVNITPACPCQTGYYADGMTLLCHKCHPRCGACDNLHANCTTCSGTNRLAAPSCNCAPGFYEDPVDNQCKECKFKCDTCDNPNTCITCRADRIGENCLCPPGFYDGMVNLCQKCILQCKECDIYSMNCTVCQGNRINIPKCVCPDHYYDDNLSIDCQPCHYTCDKCTELGCVTCAGNRILNNNQCDCPIGAVSYLATPYCSDCSVAVLLIMFLEDSSGITIQFDFSLVNKFGDINLCLKMFDTMTLKLLGAQSKCQIDTMNDKVIIATFGEGATLMENDKIGLVKDVLKHHGCANTLKTYIISKILRPVNLLAPELKLIGPLFPVSPCSQIDIYFGQQYNDGNRNFIKITWSLPNLNVPALNIIINEANLMQAQIITFPSTSFKDNSNITVSCAFTNFLNLSNSTNFTIMTINSKASYIQFQTFTDTYYGWQTITIVLNYKSLVCSNNQIILKDEQMDITITENIQQRTPANANPINLNQTAYIGLPDQDMITFNIPPFSLTIGAQYQLQAETINLVDNVKATTYFDFRIQNSPLIAQIKYGTRIQTYYKQFNVEAQVRDPETNSTWNEDQSITVFMECIDVSTLGVCRNSLGVAIPVNKTSVIQRVNDKSLMPFTVQKWQATFKKGDRSVVTFAMIVLVDEYLPELNFLYPQGWQLRKVNVNEILEIVIPLDPQSVYSEVEYSVGFIYDYNNVGIIYSKGNVLRFRIWDRFSNFTTIDKITLQLQAHDFKNFMPAVGTLTLMVNTPPMNCLFTVSPPQGNALFTNFTLLVENARDSNSPITYKYSYYASQADYDYDISNGVQFRMIDLNNFQKQSSFKTILPSGTNGSIWIVAQISDSLGSVSNQTLQVNIPSLHQIMKQQNQTCQSVVDSIQGQIKVSLSYQLIVIQELVHLYNKTDLDCQIVIGREINIQKQQLIEYFLNSVLNNHNQQQISRILSLIESLGTIAQNHRLLSTTGKSLCAVKKEESNLIQWITSDNISIPANSDLTLSQIVTNLKKVESIVQTLINDQASYLYTIKLNKDVGSESTQRLYQMNYNVRINLISVLSDLSSNLQSLGNELDQNITRNAYDILRNTLIQLSESFGVNFVINSPALRISTQQVGMNVRKLTQFELNKLVQRNKLPIGSVGYEKSDLILTISYYFLMKIVKYQNDPYQFNESLIAAFNNQTTIKSATFDKVITISPFPKRILIDPVIEEYYGNNGSSQITLPRIYEKKFALDMEIFMPYCLNSSQIQVETNSTYELICGQYQNGTLLTKCKFVQIKENATGYFTQCSCTELLPTTLFIKREQLISQTYIDPADNQKGKDVIIYGNYLDNMITYIVAGITVVLGLIMIQIRRLDNNYTQIAQEIATPQLTTLKLKPLTQQPKVDLQFINANFKKLHEIIALFQTVNPQISRAYRAILLFQHIYILIALTHVTNYFLTIYLSIVLSNIGSLMIQLLTKIMEGLFTIDIKQVRIIGVFISLGIMGACIYPIIIFDNISFEKNIQWVVCFASSFILEFTLIEYLIVMGKLKGFKILAELLNEDRFNPIINFIYYFFQNQLVRQIFKETETF